MFVLLDARIPPIGGNFSNCFSSWVNLSYVFRVDGGIRTRAKRTALSTLLLVVLLLLLLLFVLISISTDPRDSVVHLLLLLLLLLLSFSISISFDN